MIIITTKKCPHFKPIVEIISRKDFLSIKFPQVCSALLTVQADVTQHPTLVTPNCVQDFS